MSIFSSILSKIFPGAQAAPAPAPAAPSATAAPASAAPAVPAPPPSIPLGEVAPILDAKPGAAQLNWRTSIVDLLKLLGLDSSLAARKELANEFIYTGSAEPGSAEWNIWLHKQVMTRIAANGGTLPPEMR